MNQSINVPVPPISSRKEDLKFTYLRFSLRTKLSPIRSSFFFSVLPLFYALSIIPPTALVFSFFQQHNPLYIYIYLRYISYSSLPPRRFGYLFPYPLTNLASFSRE